MADRTLVRTETVIRTLVRLERGADGAQGADGLGINPDAVTGLYDINDGFQFNTSPTGTPAGVEGEVYWNPDENTLNIVTGLGNIIQLAKELWQKGTNKTTYNGGENIGATDLRVVYLKDIDTNKMTFDYADASDVTKCFTVGVPTAAINLNAEGPITTWGMVTNVDTSAYNEGDSLYVAADATGVPTTTVPEYPNHQQYIGVVVKKNANTGAIFVMPQHEYHEWLSIFSVDSITAVTGTDTCVMDMNDAQGALFTFAKTVPVTLSFSNQVSGIPGYAILEITDDGGGDAVSYNASWKEVGGTAMSVTTSGVDRWYITWTDPSDQTTYRVSQTLDWKTS